MAIESNRISVRPILDHDVELFADYLYRSTPEFLRGVGLDPARLLPEAEFRERFLAGGRQAVAGEGPVLGVSILLDEKPVGAHTLTEFHPGESAVMHAHLWKAEHRGLGIGRWSYLKAADFFFRAHGFKEILFRTPVSNTAPNRVKEKLGIPRVGEGFVDSPVALPGLKAYVYRLDSALLARLKREMGLS